MIRETAELLVDVAMAAVLIALNYLQIDNMACD
jgi:hypothetical protein